MFPNINDGKALVHPPPPQMDTVYKSLGSFDKENTNYKKC
jgi:hypothetical protein